MLFSAVTADAMQKVVDISIEKTQKQLLEYDNTLTDHQAQALASALVVGTALTISTAQDVKSYANVIKTIGKPKVTNANPLHLESSNKSEGVASTPKSLSEIGETKEPWMKKNNLSVKQREQLKGVNLYGKNPGNVIEDHSKGAIKIDTELPGGEKAARSMFEQMSGKKPKDVIETKQGEDITLQNGIRIQIRMGKSGHPKLEITTPTDKGKILEKITFKEWNHGE